MHVRIMLEMLADLEKATEKIRKCSYLRYSILPSDYWE